MKLRSFLFLLVIITNVVSAQAIKTVLRQPTFRGDVRDFAVVGSTMYMVGYDINVSPGISFVCKSTNQGASWTELPSPFGATDYLTAISFPTLTTGYVAGAGGHIYKTTDGGLTWQNKTDSANYSSGINNLYFVSPDSGYFCGSGTNILYKTVDGGTTWTAITTPTTNAANHMLWQNWNKGWVVCNSCRVLYTTDAGANWTVSTPASGTLYRIRQVSPDMFVAAGGSSTTSTFLKSTDGGVTFTASNFPANGSYYTIEFTDVNNGWAMGSAGIVYRTTNGGASWVLQQSFTNEVIRTSTIAYGKIFAGAYKSTIATMPIGDSKFTTITNDARDLFGLYMESPTSFAMCGDRGNVYLSTNSGYTWTMTALLPGILGYDIYKNGNSISVCGQSGTYYLSENNGGTWGSNPTGTSTTRNYRMQWINSTTAYMVSNDGTIYYTTNKGANWTLKNTISGAILYDIKMIDSVGYAVGSGLRIYKTTDYGNTWNHGTLAQPAGQVAGITMLNANVGFICGENGSVYRTTTGFRSITLLTDTVALAGKTIHDVIALNDSTAWAVGGTSNGNSGVILHSVSASQMVEYQSFPTTFYAMTKISDRGFITVGASGTVIKVEERVVPVELTALCAARSNNGILIQWSTASEKNNRGFEIQTSTDNVSWSSGSFVAGKGTSQQHNAYQFLLPSPVKTVVFIRLKQIDFDGSEQLSSAVEVTGQAGAYALEQNYPNPFNPSTGITYNLPAASRVSLTVYDMLGREIAVLVNSMQDAGTHTIAYDGSGLPSGFYIYKIKAAGSAGLFEKSLKMMMIK